MFWELPVIRCFAVLCHNKSYHLTLYLWFQTTISNFDSYTLIVWHLQCHGKPIVSHV